MLYGTITDFCTEDNCPIMSAGPKYEYHWADGRSVKKPIKCSAPKYIDFLMTWVQDQLDDESLFPSKIGVPFPKDFMLIGKMISNLNIATNPIPLEKVHLSLFISIFYSKDHIEEAVSGVCTYIPSTFQRSRFIGRGGSFKHFF